MKNKDVLDVLSHYLSIDKINDLLINQNHSYLMIYDLLKRDYPQFFEYKNYSKSGFIKFMKAAGFTFDLLKYNSQQNYFKLQYKFPASTSLDELKKIQKQQAQDGQKKTIQIRKQDTAFNKKQSLQYWMSVCNDKQAAKKALDKYKKEASPFCMEFYIKRGYNEADARKHILRLNCMGALAALKKVQKPKTEEIVKNILEKNNIEYVCQYKIKLKKEEKRFRKSFYVYDFYLPKLNVLIDCHGTYWHCDPRIYKSGDKIKFAGREKVIVDAIWDIDNHRKEVALTRNYKYYVLWELDLKEWSDERIVSVLRN